MGWLKRRRARAAEADYERRKQAAAERIGPLVEEMRRIQRMAMVEVVKQDIQRGVRYTDDDFRAAHRESTTEDLEGVISAHADGIVLYAEQHRVPKETWSSQPILAELLRRKKLYEEVLAERR